MQGSRVEALDISDPVTAAQVWEAQQAAYRVEADLVGFDEIPPLHETLHEMVAKPLRWLGVRDRGGGVKAAMALSRNGSVVDIDRLFVAPGSFRRGYARSLLTALGSEGTITVSTARENKPAVRLYESLGFDRVGEEEVVVGLFIVHFRREAA